MVLWVGGFSPMFLYSTIGVYNSMRSNLQSSSEWVPGHACSSTPTLQEAGKRLTAPEARSGRPDGVAGCTSGTVQTPSASRSFVW